MKLENTLENKSRFFVQYWRQDVLCRVIFGKNKNEIIMHNTPCSNLKLGEIIDSYLELKPLSQISDEDVIKISKEFPTFKSDIRNSVKELFQEFDGLELSMKTGDYLRSKGYALSYMDLSVEDLVEYGWVKLKEN